jgi:superfamily II DNA or RNA helicase
VPDVQLTTALFAEMAGWEAMKQARSLLAAGRVLSSEWQPPVLRGALTQENGSLRAGLVIRGRADVENLCPCRDSRQRGIICAHSIAIGLHHLESLSPAASAKTPASPAVKPASKPVQKAPAKALRRAQPGESGEPLELSLILPPNFADALAKGKIMLYAEGKWRKGRMPLNALPLTEPFSLSAEDAPLLDALERLNEGDTPAMLLLSASQFAGLLPLLSGHPRVTLGKTQAVEISSEPFPLKLKAELLPTGQISLSAECGVRNAQSGQAVLNAGESGGLWVYSSAKLQPLPLRGELCDLLKGPLQIDRARVPMFLNVDWPRLVAGSEIDANFALEDFTFDAATPEFRLHLAGGLAMLQADLQCYYAGKPITALPNDAGWMPDAQSPTHYQMRNPQAEQEALARLMRHGFSGPDAKGLFHLKGQEQVLNFFAREYPRLEREWKVTLEERLDQSTRKNLERIDPKFQITPSGEQWFDLSIAYDTSAGERFAPADIQRLLLSGQSHTRLKNGKFALLDTGAVEELQEVLVDCAPRQRDGGYRLGNAQAGFLEATLNRQPRWAVQAPSAWKQRAAQLRGDIQFTPPPLGALDSVLRPYQKEGVAWLAFLRAQGFGGVLADEMGLGKTLQVLAHLSALYARTRTGAPTLVVCPTSLVFNWVAEAAKFTPGLKTLAIQGQGARRQELIAEIPRHDLVVTSYALLRRDADAYRAFEFDTVVLDEAQHIKNRQTQNAQAVKSIRTRQRLVLTGTPLENSVLDLWSIFDFLMPGYLGAAQDFRERYEIPITREKNAAAQSRLGRRLRPFLLRRLKRDVAADLPARIEQVSFCDLNDDQRALYQQVLDASRREIVNAVGASGLAKSRMLVLTTLLRLRQICSDLRLLNLQPAQAEEPSAASTSSPAVAGPSGKVELFHELLEEVLDGGHRVLVFSQFTTMLGLLREELAEREIPCCYLDGSTKDRAKVVEQFQRDSAIPVFLISLKAGGVGLNLTGADTVIHFDPWWNPAVEAQATDRAHRIGQKRVVTSYKLITRGTVEEKILNLQARKRALFQNLLGAEESLTESLTWDEIQDLLSA